MPSLFDDSPPARVLNQPELCGQYEVLAPDCLLKCTLNRQDRQTLGSALAALNQKIVAFVERPLTISYRGILYERHIAGKPPKRLQ
jgi:hypothetical protein